MRLASLALLAAALAAPCAAQVVHGRVVTTRPEAPAAGATVELLGDDQRVLATTTTDSAGRFEVTAAAAGSYRLAAEGAGARRAVSRELELEAGDTLEVVFRLAPDTVLLNPLRVVASPRRRSGWLDGFYRRAERSGFGWFVTREEIDRRTVLRTSDLLRSTPGITVTPARRGVGSVVRGRGGCFPAVFLDGMRLAGGAASIDDVTQPEELEGIEIYHGAAVPVEFAGPGSACGAVLLWTRIDE